MSKWWPGTGHSVRETDLSICIFDRQTLCPVGKTGLEWLFLFFSDRLAKLHRCHPENRFTLFGIGFGYPRILSENRFALFGMRFGYPRILSENRFTLFGMRGVCDVIK